MLRFEDVWARIAALEREFFKTHQGEWFTYRIRDDRLLPSRSGLEIPRADFELVLPMLPLRDPRKVAKFVTGYPYLAAVLADPRVSRGDW